MNLEGWGVTPQGFRRPPLSVIKAWLENDMMTVFGPDVLQTAQTPIGQLNGLMAETITKIFEFGEQLYTFNDPDVAQGVNLDILARLRLISRQVDELEEDFRRAITNADRARVDIQDLIRAIINVPGVTYTEIFLPEDGLFGEFTVPDTSVAIAVEGGDPQDLANVIRAYVVPGINTYGNTAITGEIEGRCRTFYIVRPILVPVTLSLQVRLRKDANGCSPPSTADIRLAVINAYFKNGENINHFMLRSLIEPQFNRTVELVTFTGWRDNITEGLGNPVSIGFMERVVITLDSVSVEAVP